MSNNCCYNPCPPASNQPEPLSSILQNLQQYLFGQIIQVFQQNGWVWQFSCDPNALIPCFPKGADEGFVCYLLRIVSELGLFYQGPWDVLLDYCKHQVVSYNNVLYVAIGAVPAGTLPTNTIYWDMLIEGIPGPIGPQGPPGPSGPPNTPNYGARVLTVSDTLTNTDEMVFCEPAAGAITITLPLQASVDNYKYYKLHSNGAFTINIAPTGVQTIEGAASYSLPSGIPTAIEFVSRTNGDWKIQ